MAIDTLRERVTCQARGAIPPQRRHRHRYHGVLAPNAPWREQITADANEQARLHEPVKQTAAEKAPSETKEWVESKPLNRPWSHYSKSRYWPASSKSSPHVSPVRPGSVHHRLHHRSALRATNPRSHR